MNRLRASRWAAQTLGQAMLLAALAVPAAGQVAHPPTPSPSVVVADASAAATTTLGGGHLMEGAIRRGVPVRLPLGLIEGHGNSP